jgi:hypothetical protein
MEEKKPVRTIIDKENGNVVGHACGNCGTFFSALVGFDDSKAAAERCHNYKCSECGVKTNQYYTICDKCRKDKEFKKDLEAFERAEKIKFEDYHGEMVFFDDCSLGNEGYMSTDDVEDHFCDSDKELPEFAWACDWFGISIDVDHVLETALEEHHEDAFDLVSQADIDELKTMLKTWCDKQGVKTYTPNSKKAIVFSDEFRKSLKE